MIIVSHDFFIVKSVSVDGNLVSFNSKFTIGETIYTFAEKYNNKIIIWCHEKVKEKLNFAYINECLIHDRLLVTYTPFENFLQTSIGYIEDSPFININKKVQYPTWQMSSYAGAIKSKIILVTDFKFWKNSNFDYTITSIAKTYQSLGLFCYSDPKLIQEEVLINNPKASLKQLFSFVKQHYKVSWIYLLLLNLVIYEKRFPFIPFLYALLFTKKNAVYSGINFNDKESRINFSDETIDVIIPTIGRKKYLYDVLCDLKNQSHLPENVIIVEQNPLSSSVSELDYLTNENWPFVIKHFFTHQTGACQARNQALKEVKSKWVFLADDDIRIELEFINFTIQQLNNYNSNATILSCLKSNEIKMNNIVSQTTVFGSGCSFIKRSKCENLFFDKVFEHGFGEDMDFGLQLRNLGIDVLYLPTPEIIHLKAPTGGFRTKFIHPWEYEKIQPKPSPTVLCFRLKHYTKEQNNGYKTVLFLKFFKKQSIKNPLKYIVTMNARWNQSVKWAKKMLNEN